MLAVQIQRTGGPEVLEVVDLPEPAPGPGEILIRQEAVGLNFIDTYQRGGLYPMSLPAVLGNEGAGIVEAVGEGVERFAVGDRPGRKSVHLAEFLDRAGELLVESLGIGTVQRQPKSLSQESDSCTAAAPRERGSWRNCDLRQLRPVTPIPCQSVAKTFVDRVRLLQRLKQFHGVRGREEALRVGGNRCELGIDVSDTRGSAGNAQVAYVCLERLRKQALDPCARDAIEGAA